MKIAILTFDKFISRFEFSASDLESRIDSIRWFENVGKPFEFDLSMKAVSVSSWSEAIELCEDVVWENTTLEAQNQLTEWLALNAKESFQDWNSIVLEHKKRTLEKLTEEKILPFLKSRDLDSIIADCVAWDMLGALMENSYLDLKTGHKNFFFLEIFSVYEAGHFPCGWHGDFPDGRLSVY